MKTFSQFINENSGNSAFTELFTELVNSIREGGYGVKSVKLNPDLSIELYSEWEFDTMKISGLGRVEPVGHYRTKLIPKIEKYEPAALNRLIQLGLTSPAKMIDGFTIITSLRVEVEDLNDFEYVDGPDEGYYSLNALEEYIGESFREHLEENNIEAAAHDIIDWFEMFSNEYAHDLTRTVAKKLEQFMLSRKEEDND